MNGIGLLVLLALVRAYYRRKWEGAHAGAPLDLKWIRRRIDFTSLERSGQVLSCHYEKSKRALVFLVQDGATLEWRFCRHTMARGWIMD